jgi:uncharacterized membrane protein
MDSANLLIWVHILAMSAYFGAQFAVIYMLLPVAEQAGDESRRRAALITGFKFYNPFTIAMLGIVVITGAMRLTDVKAEMKFEYFTRIWAALSLKLGLAFLLIFIQTYITFGLSFRIGRQEEVAAHGDGEPFTVERLNSMLSRIRAMIWVTIILTAAIIFVSLTVMKRAVSETASIDAMVDTVSHQSKKGGNDPRQRQESEDHPGQLVEHRVASAIDSLARDVVIHQTGDGHFIESCIHGSVPQWF